MGSAASGGWKNYRMVGDHAQIKTLSNTNGKFSLTLLAAA
jgi:hypothetical protein